MLDVVELFESIMLVVLNDETVGDNDLIFMLVPIEPFVLGVAFVDDVELLVDMFVVFKLILDESKPINVANDAGDEFELLKMVRAIVGVVVVVAIAFVLKLLELLELLKMIFGCGMFI